MNSPYNEYLDGLWRESLRDQSPARKSQGVPPLLARVSNCPTAALLLIFCGGKRNVQKYASLCLHTVSYAYGKDLHISARLLATPTRQL